MDARTYADVRVMSATSNASSAAAPGRSDADVGEIACGIPNKTNADRAVRSQSNHRPEPGRGLPRHAPGLSSGAETVKVRFERGDAAKHTLPKAVLAA